MLKSLPDPLRGLFSLTVLTVNTIFWCLLLFLVAIPKLLIPIGGWRTACSRLSNTIAQSWVWCNSSGLELTKDIHWDIRGIDDLKPDEWYLLVANHQSMVDIAVLQKTFHRKAPPLKFFLKKELFWVPVLGMAWWALDFPFMKRTGSARKDLETARNACEKFRPIPVTIMNFVEGTRFTRAKQKEQNSPYANLLKPKTGGLAVVLGTMGEQLHSIVDVTIVYPQGVPELWKFLCVKSFKVIVHVKQLPVTGELTGDYLTDRAYRRQFNDWLNTLWGEKDKLIGSLLKAADHESGAFKED